MKTVFFILVFLVANLSFSQVDAQEHLEVEGSIQIGDSHDDFPDPGTIRWSGKDFEGWNGERWISLTKPADGTTGMVFDIEGNGYRTVQIGHQVWMAQNLNTSKYRNGETIDNIKLSADWLKTDLTSRGAWCWYDNNPNNEMVYGKLYNWFAVNDSRGLCPIGRKVPTRTDMDQLITYLGGASSGGGKLRETGFIWNSPNTGATNESGFSALPGGSRNAYDGGFYSLRTRGDWWSSTDHNVGQAFYFWTYNLSNAVIKSPESQKSGFSVRCVKIE